MKIAGQNLLKKLLYTPTGRRDIFDHNPSFCGQRGKFYWRQSCYDKYKKAWDCRNNYVLLDSGLIVTFSLWLEPHEEEENNLDLYFLGWGCC